MSVVIVSATLDKASYAPGDVATLTVVRTDTSTTTSTATGTVTVTVTDGASGATTTSDVSFDEVTTATVEGASTVSAADSSGRVWTVQSDTAGTAVLTATI